MNSLRSHPVWRVGPVIGLTLLFLSALFMTLSLDVSAAPNVPNDTAVFINELHYDNVDADVGEGVEVAGPAGTDLTGWSIVFYNGSGGASYGTANLSGTIPDLQNGCGVISIAFSGIQNGAPDGLALVDDSNSVIQFLSYEGSFTATDGPANGMISVDIGVSETGTTPVGYSLQLTGSGANYEDFSWAAPMTDTFDAVNTGQTFNCLVTAPEVVETDPADGATAVAINATIAITFSEPVTVTANWFTLACATSGAVSGATAPASPATAYTITPDTPFAYNEACTVTVLAPEVVNGSGLTMTANYPFTFTTQASIGDITFVYHDLEDVAQVGEDLLIGGTFNSWDPTGYTLTPDAAYEVFTITVPNLSGDIEYKYIVNTSGSGQQWDWLNTSNRTYTVVGDATLHDHRNVTPGYMILNSPTIVTTDLGVPTADLNGELYIQSVTNPAGPGIAVLAEVGYGDDTDLDNWTWFPVSQVGQNGNNDLYQGVITPTSPGVYSYTFRFNGNSDPANPNYSWFYADSTGVGPYPGGEFSFADLGVMTVEFDPPFIIINELDSDTPGTDEAEFIELYDGGVGNIPLDALVVVLYNGNGDTSYAAFDLDGYSTNAEGYFVLGNAAISQAEIVFPSNTLQNGADAVALYVGNAADFPNGTAVSLDNLLDAVVYDTNDADDAGLLVLLNPDQPQVNEGENNSATDSIQRCPNGSGGQRNTDTYFVNLPSPGARNHCPGLQITKSGPEFATAGTTIIYDLVIENSANFDALNVVLTDTLPLSTTLVADNIGGGTMVAPGVYTWALGTVFSQTVHTYQLTVTIGADVSEGTVLTNLAELATDTADDDPSDNSDTAVTTILPPFEITDEFTVERLGSYTGSGSEIAAHDPVSQTLYVVTGGEFMEILDINDPFNPVLLDTIAISPTYGSGANSVDVYDGVVAVAVQNFDKTQPGLVVFFDRSGTYLNQVTAGPLPDMLTFSHDGSMVLVANEGEPNDDYTIDPEGSISIVDLSGGVLSATAVEIGFTHFTTATLDPAVRIFGPGATVAQDLEPEYITLSADDSTAWVTLQENNAVAIVDTQAMTVTAVVPLGFKDHSLPGNELDPSNQDGGIHIANWPVLGMYQPDAITSFELGGTTYLVTANEGDARDYAGFSEEARIATLTLDPTAFPNAATLQLNENLGRLNSTLANGDTDGDGDFDELYAYGARSFSIWNGGTGELVYDSGNDLEELTALFVPDYFNANSGDAAQFDQRSDDKGPEPEGATLGVINGRTYAFIGLERTGGIVIYDVTDPLAPFFAYYIEPADADANNIYDDISPEGLLFIDAADSPTGYPLLVVTYELSGSTVVYQLAFDADVSVAKSGPATGVIGEEVVYTIELNNNTSAVAADFIFTDTLSAGLTYVSDDSGITPDNPAPGVYVWNLGNVPPYFSFTVHLTATIDGDVISGATLNNTATISTSSLGDDPGDNQSVATTTAYPITKIHEIQGDGDAVVPGTYTVEAIVVGDYQGLAGVNDFKLDGFFIQEEDADVDGDPQTSEGIFVFCLTCPVDVQVGDLVRVTGASSDYFGMSQLSVIGADAMVVVSSSNTLPTPAVVTLPVPGVTATDLPGAQAQINAYFEPFEGMLVTVEEELTVAEYFQLSRYGQVVLTQDGRFRQFTDANAPDVDGYTASLIERARRTIILDDDSNQQNHALFENVPVFHPVPGFSITNYFRGGDTIANLTGVLHWSFAGLSGTDAWRIRPVTETYEYEFSAVNTRPETPAEVSGTLRVASFNVLNYFTTLGERGANSIAELDRQAEKIVAAFAGLNADIIGVMEIENNNDVAIADLVSRLNADAGAGTYEYIATGTVGDDQITVGIIYKPASVTPVGAAHILTDTAFTDPNNTGGQLSRPAIAQTFADGNGEQVTVVVNHLKSKNCGSATGLDADQGDGQGCWNDTRQKAADYLVNTWIPALTAEIGDPDFLIVGDLNAYRQEDPITNIVNAGYTDLLDALLGEDAYGYVFDGYLGYLDHALASPTLMAQVTGVSEWHINADEVNLLDYNDTILDPGEQPFDPKPGALPLYEPDAYRSSDHDPVLVGLQLFTVTPVTPTVSILTPMDGDVFTSTNGTAVSIPVVITTTDFIIPDDGHWHLWVDGAMVGPVLGYTTTVDLLPGVHTISAELRTPDHVSLGIIDTVTVTVQAEYTLYLPVIMNEVEATAVSDTPPVASANNGWLATLFTLPMLLVGLPLRHRL